MGNTSIYDYEMNWDGKAFQNIIHTWLWEKATYLKLWAIGLFSLLIRSFLEWFGHVFSVGHQPINVHKSIYKSPLKLIRSVLTDVSKSPDTFRWKHAITWFCILLWFSYQIWILVYTLVWGAKPISSQAFTVNWFRWRIRNKRRDWPRRNIEA